MRQMLNKSNKESVNINKIKNIKTINEHNNYVISLLLLSDGRLASGSTDKTIKIYDMNNNYHCDITINTGHTGTVTYICELDNNKLISCSGDKSIKIWSINKSSYQLDYTIYKAHDNGIYKVISLRNNRIASCSGDETIKIWNSNYPYNLIKVLKGHTDRVSSIIELKDKDILISGSYFDKTLRKWNLLTYQCETIINNVYCYDSNGLLEIDNNRVIIGGLYVITIVNISSNDIIEQKIENYELKIFSSFLKLRDGNILCGSSNGKICLYNIKLNTISFKEKEIHNGRVKCLLNIHEHQFISCSWDNTIKVWEY